MAFSCVVLMVTSLRSDVVGVDSVSPGGIARARGSPWSATRASTTKGARGRPRVDSGSRRGSVTGGTATAIADADTTVSNTGPSSHREENAMRADIIDGGTCPAYQLTDHTKTRRRLSELRGRRSLILVLSRALLREGPPATPQAGGDPVGDRGRLHRILGPAVDRRPPGRPARGQ